MPEMITKYPELAIKELKDAKISCGEGKKQQILITCPKDRFCSLPTGELCIYGIKEVPHMTQVGVLDLFLFPSFALVIIAFMVVIFLIGFLLGATSRKK